MNRTKMTKNGQKWFKNRAFGLLKKIKSLGLSGIGVKRKFLWPTDIRLFRKKNQTGRVEDILFWESPGISLFFSLPLEIPDKTKLNPWKFHKIASYPLEIPRTKAKTPGNFIFYLLWYPLKFHFLNLTLPPPVCSFLE